ncbi:hypothetical protein HV346_08750 [Enterobacter sp. RHBSTW-00994]|uniref:hypothetical protein n=1 Tax=Enterobacter sp. RHBSTW-00994 TaxID=2742676 RepID=UPI0015EA7AB2|nr:hypothetical protein [Enterobacter sp. RHBSTW-00994]QLR42753.1 hypothetical protein HV346_08750 [Enterobacter sp. RHBSTW-00994]
MKRLWLSYSLGLHIPATRWIGILPKNPRTAAEHVPITVLQLLPVFSPHQAQWILSFPNNKN